MINKRLYILLSLFLLSFSGLAQSYKPANLSFEDIVEEEDVSIFEVAFHTSGILSWYHSKKTKEKGYHIADFGYKIGSAISFTPTPNFSIIGEVNIESIKCSYRTSFIFSPPMYNYGYYPPDIVNNEQLTFLNLPIKFSYIEFDDGHNYAKIGAGVYFSRLLSGKYSYDYYEYYDEYGNIDLIKTSIINQKMPTIQIDNSIINFSTIDYGYTVFFQTGYKLLRNSIQFGMNVNIGKKNIYNHVNDELLNYLYPLTTKIKSIEINLGVTL